MPQIKAHSAARGKETPVLEENAGREPRRAAELLRHRPRQLEIDVLRPRDLQRVLNAVTVPEELLEPPGEEVQLFRGQLLVRIERVEDREPDLELGEVIA